MAVALEMMTGTLPVFVTSTFWAGLVVVSDCGVNTRTDVDNVKAAVPAAPVPVRVTVVFGLEELLDTNMLPLRSPSWVGRKEMLTMQLVFDASEAGQVLLCA